MKLEKYDAIVTSNSDEEYRGRIKVACAGLLGDENAELPDWVLPKFDWGWFHIPDVGEIVEIEVASDSDTDEIFGQSTIDGLDIYWTGKRHWTDEETYGENESRPIPADFIDNYGKRRGFATPSGHIIYFDDTNGEQKIHISWRQNEKTAFLTFNEDGSILLTDANGSFVELNATDQAISMESNKISANSDDVNLGNGADNYLIRGDDFKITYDVHTHPGPFGPTGAPIVLLPINNISTTTKVK